MTHSLPPFHILPCTSKYFQIVPRKKGKDNVNQGLMNKELRPYTYACLLSIELDEEGNAMKVFAKLTEKFLWYLLMQQMYYYIVVT